MMIRKIDVAPSRTEAYNFFVLELRAKVAVAAEEGLAVVTGEEPAKSDVIALSPWGKVEGVIMEGDRPMAGVKVGLDWDAPYEEGEVSVNYSYDRVVTDKEVQFSFPRVPAFKTDISVRRADAESALFDFPIAAYGPVDVTLGQTVRVRYGDRGRPVKGRIEVPVMGTSLGTPHGTAKCSELGRR
jgi:hypothetical protein